MMERPVVHPSEREHGVIAVMVAIVAVLLMACIAFAVDLGYAWQVRRGMVKATDASALAAAKTQSEGTPSTGDCPANVRAVASTYLTANSSSPTMDFCVVTGALASGTSSDSSSGSYGSTGSTLGTLTVRGSSTASFSFAKLFGLNSTTVSSSTTVEWIQPPMVPLIACVGTNSQPSDWFADRSTTRAPVTVAQQWSGSLSADPCSSGASDSYALVDFSTVPYSTSDASACTTQPSTIATSLESWLTSGYSGKISVGDYRCARVGQPYGTKVDQAICKLRGRTAVIPLIDIVDKQEVPGDGKADLVRVAGFAAVTIDDYTPLNGSNQCDVLPSTTTIPGSGTPLRATPIAERRPAMSAALPSTRHRDRARRTPRPAASDTVNLKVDMNPAKSVVGDAVVGSVTVSVPAGSTKWSGSLTLNFTNPRPSITWVFPSNGACGPLQSDGSVTCTGLSVGSGGSATYSFGSTFGSTGTGTVTATLSETTATASASYTVEAAPPPPTEPPPSRSASVTIAGTGTGSVKATALGQTTQTCTTGTCTWTYPSNTSVTLTATPNAGSVWAGWSGDCTGTSTTCTVKISSTKARVVTATFNPAPPPPTPTIDPLTFRILTMTFVDSMSSGTCCSGIDHLYAYRICDVDLKTRDEAMNPPDCPSDGGNSSSLGPPATAPRLLAVRITSRRPAHPPLRATIHRNSLTPGRNHP
jgi:uncharacterized repeat protein (TIGR02543 family)